MGRRSQGHIIILLIMHFVIISVILHRLTGNGGLKRIQQHGKRFYGLTWIRAVRCYIPERVGLRVIFLFVMVTKPIIISILTGVGGDWMMVIFT